jgi:hypothetical protein
LAALSGSERLSDAGVEWVHLGAMYAVARHTWTSQNLRTAIRRLSVGAMLCEAARQVGQLWRIGGVGALEPWGNAVALAPLLLAATCSAQLAILMWPDTQGDTLDQADRAVLLAAFWVAIPAAEMLAFFATAGPSWGFVNAQSVWNVAIPLAIGAFTALRMNRRGRWLVSVARGRDPAFHLERGVQAQGDGGSVRRVLSRVYGPAAPFRSAARRQPIATLGLPRWSLGTRRALLSIPLFGLVCVGDPAGFTSEAGRRLVDYRVTPCGSEFALVEAMDDPSGVVLYAREAQGTWNRYVVGHDEPIWQGSIDLRPHDATAVIRGYGVEIGRLDWRAKQLFFQGRLRESPSPGVGESDRHSPETLFL